MLLLLLSHFSHLRLSATPWTVAYQAPLSMGFARQEYWSGVPLPPLLSINSMHNIKLIEYFSVKSFQGSNKGRYFKTLLRKIALC